MILLDTNVISELVKGEPDPHVFRVIDALPLETVFTAAVCEAEIRYGLACLPPGRRRNELTDRIDRFFEEGFGDRVLPFDRICAAMCGDIRQTREAAGRAIAIADAMIAATARAYGAKALFTRNVTGFEGCGITLVDPWTAG